MNICTRVAIAGHFHFDDIALEVNAMSRASCGEVGFPGSQAIEFQDLARVPVHENKPSLTVESAIDPVVKNSDPVDQTEFLKDFQDAVNAHAIDALSALLEDRVQLVSADRDIKGG